MKSYRNTGTIISEVDRSNKLIGHTVCDKDIYDTYNQSKKYSQDILGNVKWVVFETLQKKCRFLLEVFTLRVMVDHRARQFYIKSLKERKRE